MEYKNYYKILGVDKGATQKEIKSAYRKLAREHHPDVNPDDAKAQERFKDINEAHQVLGDPEKREKYDQLGSNWRQWERTGGRPEDFNWGRWATEPGGQRVHVRYGTPEDLEDIFGGAGFGGFSDFFEQIFGGMRGGSRPAPDVAGWPQSQRQHGQLRKGQDIEQSVEITLEEAFHGTKRLFQTNGSRIEASIPRGVKSGSKVRLGGKGMPGGAGVPPGDLYLKIKVKPHPAFERRGADLYVDVDVPLYTALLGGEVRAPTLTGDKVLTIPAETQNGQGFRLSGQGMPRLRHPDEQGDLYARMNIMLPKNLTTEEEELIRQLKALRE
ncbi:MAG: Chaperone protein DnaJ [Anaerolineales bacterium]|nr:Chaperone protein DnaJ [Anaerolineales bacterium]